MMNAKRYMEGWTNGRFGNESTEPLPTDPSYSQGLQDGKEQKPYWDGFWAARFGCQLEAGHAPQYAEGYKAGLRENEKKLPGGLSAESPLRRG